MYKEHSNMGPPPMTQPPSYTQSAATAPYPPGFYPPGPVPPPGANPPIQAIITTAMPLGPQSSRATCPSCHSEITTSTDTEAGTRTYLMSGLCLLFGCWLGCFLIPCCMEDCLDVRHTCPNCKAHLGTYKR